MLICCKKSWERIKYIQPRPRDTILKTSGHANTLHTLLGLNKSYTKVRNFGRLRNILIVLYLMSR